MKISKALVFDIKRFAVHDGDGIRTTIFFKGCPLRCRWCQNPEGLFFEKKLIYLEKNCIHCRYCEKYADEGQIIYKDRPYFQKDYHYDNLVRICPAAAIRYDSEEYDIESLMKIIKEDTVFYRENGGVTFSGGEPLMQGEFLLELLKKCKEEGIHTAVETTVYVSLDYVKKVLPYLDQIYIDLKIFDDSQHCEYTGVSNRIIKENIEYILRSEYRDKVIIRTPLIPTMTAYKENIENIARFIYNLYYDVKYELLNYNPLASSKYELLDMEYGVDKKYNMYTKDELNAFYQVVYQVGLKNLIIE